MGVVTLTLCCDNEGQGASEAPAEVVESLVHTGGQSLWRHRAIGGLLPLHIVAARGDVDLARWLVEEQQVPDAHAPDASGATPAVLADRANHTELARLFREWQAEAPSRGEL